MIVHINKIAESMTPEAFFKYALLIGPSVEYICTHDYRVHGFRYRALHKVAIESDGLPKLRIISLLWCYALTIKKVTNKNIYGTRPFLCDPNSGLSRVYYTIPSGHDNGGVHDIEWANYNTFKHAILEVYGDELSKKILDFTTKYKKEWLKIG